MKLNLLNELENMRGFNLTAKESCKLLFLSLVHSKIKNKWCQYLLSSILKIPLNWVAWECCQHNFLKRSQDWSDLDIRDYRFKKFKHLLNYVYNKVPYYRNLFRKLNFEPDKDFKSLKDLCFIPILTKEDVVNFRDQLISSDFLKYKDSFRVQKHYTSGTTGKPLLLYSDLKRVLIWKVIAERRLEWIGISPIARSAQLWSVPFCGNTNNIKTNNALFYSYNEDSNSGAWSRNNSGLHKNIACFIPDSNIIYISSMPLSKKCRLEQLSILNKFKPLSVTGNPSLLSELACLANENQSYLFKFKTFISKYETLWPHQRNSISDTFGCFIYSAYSNKEGTINAFGCEYGRYHEEKESCIMEVVDSHGKESLPGKRGRVLGTDLFNYAMPFIRYESGDIGIRHDSRCDCNRGSDFIILEGRTAEKLCFKDKVIYPSTLSVILRDIQGIKECQFKQKGDEAIEAYIIRRDFKDNTLERRIAEKFRERIDPKIKIVIRYVNEFNVSDGGKFNLIDFSHQKIKP